MNEDVENIFTQKPFHEANLFTGKLILERLLNFDTQNSGKQFQEVLLPSLDFERRNKMAKGLGNSLTKIT